MIASARNATAVTFALRPATILALMLAVIFAPTIVPRSAKMFVALFAALLASRAAADDPRALGYIGRPPEIFCFSSIPA